MQEFHYVSSVKGHLVTRFPTLQMSVAQYIGATRKGKEVTWDETEVVAISEQEWAKYRREYRRCLADKSLVERTKEDFAAYVEEKTKREDEALKAQQVAALKRAEEEKAKGESDQKQSQPDDTSPKGKRVTR